MGFGLIVLILCFLPNSYGAASSEQALTSMAIVEMAWEELDLQKQNSLAKQAVEGYYANQTALANPEISYGAGQVSNSLGLKAGFSEWGVNQKISISGWKNRLNEQKNLALELADLQTEQQKLFIAEQTLKLVYQLKVQEEQQEHSHERLKRLRKLTVFLKSKPYPSPQQKVELELIRAKIMEVSLEVDFLDRNLNATKKSLQHLLGREDLPTLGLEWQSYKNFAEINRGLLKRKSAEIKRQENEILQVDKNKEAQSVQWIPDLNLYYSQSEEQYLGGNSNQVFGLSLEIPIFNQKNSISKSLQSKMQGMKIDLERSRKKQKLEYEEKKAMLDKSLLALSRYTTEYVNEKETFLNRETKNFDKGLISARQFIDLEENVHSVHFLRLDYLMQSHALILELIRAWGSEQQLREFLK